MITEPIKTAPEIENTYNYYVDSCLASTTIPQGAKLYPILLPSNITNGTGLMNPSIAVVNNKLLLNIRHVNYTFYHSERKLFQHPWGPLTYLHPEDDMHLRTTNYLCELDDNMRITSYNKIDTSAFDTYHPRWDFVGLEDLRLVYWDSKLYGTGVRRDTTTEGQGRMELSELSLTSSTETSRVRIEPPRDKNSYCEKNWMPVVDQPYTYVKWSNPTEVVVVDPVSGSSKTIKETQLPNAPANMRGGSQVLPLGSGYHIALIHEVDLFKSTAGRKDAVYRHRFIVWDADWNIVKYTKDFSLLNGHVEFVAGLCFKDDKTYISFGYQDNAAYILELPTAILATFLNDN